MKTNHKYFTVTAKDRNCIEIQIEERFKTEKDAIEFLNLFEEDLKKDYHSFCITMKHYLI